MHDVKRYEDLIRKATAKIKELNTKLSEERENKDIAILGYSCRFPGGANSPEEYWKLLCDGFDAVTEIPANRFRVMEYYDPTRGKRGKTYTKEGAFLQCDIKQFDNHLFEMSEMEATSIDPQHRLILEVTWEALQNAGVNLTKAKGSKTGVYIGMISNEYGMSEVASDSPYKITPYSLMGNYTNSAAGRISYFFDFKGPCMAIDTACSSSMVAFNEAVVALRTHQCDMAIVGGANLLLTPNGFIGMSQINALSEDGRCRAFDADASGYGRGEGCGVVVLKRLQDAKRDNDNIHAVVKSISVMHGGKANGFFAPNGLQEQAVMHEALRLSGMSAEDVDYVEAHGTGTVLGDAIESKAIHSVYGDRKKDLLVGSVKTNVGHMEAAAGIASIIKVLLSLKNEKLPPSIHYNKPNPDCSFPHLRVLDHLVSWKSNEKPRVAAVSSYGISGTLGHMIIQEYRDYDRDEYPSISKGPALFTLSAATKGSLLQSLLDYEPLLSRDDLSLTDIAYASNQTRSGLGHRFAAVVNSKAELKNLLRDCEKNEMMLMSCYGEAVLNTDRCSVIFTPFDKIDLQEIKWIMAVSMAFKNTFVQFDRKYQELCDVSIFDYVYGRIVPSKKLGTVLLQVALHCAYVRMLEAIAPPCGEYYASGIGWIALAYIAGVLSIEETAAIAVALEFGDESQIETVIRQIVPKKANRDLVSRKNAELLQDLRGWIYSDLAARWDPGCSSSWKLNIVFGHATANEGVLCFDCTSNNFLRSLRRLYLLGAELNWHRIDDVFLYPLRSQPFLPGYRYFRKTCWNDPVYFGGTSESKDVVEQEQAVQKIVTIENLPLLLSEKAASISGLLLEDVETARPLAVYGFDSFSYMMLSSELKQWFGLDVDVKDFYEELKTIDDICAYVRANFKQETIHFTAQTEKISSEVEDYPMSTMQARIFTEQLLSDAALYDMVGVYYVEDELDIQRLEYCVNEQFRRHNVLRAGLFLQSGNFCMRIAPNCSLQIKSYTQPEGVPLVEFIRSRIKRFNLEQPPLMEIFLVSASDGKELVVFHFHHTISDGISMNLYASELMRMYQGEDLPILRRQYGDFALQEQTFLQSQQFSVQQSFWLNSLENVIIHLPLPFDYQDANHSVAGDSVLTTINAETMGKIRELCGAQGATPFMFFHACVCILLHRLTNEDHIAVAIPVSCRNGEFLQSIGMFTNTVAVRSHYQRGLSFLHFLEEVRQFNTQFIENIAYPFNDLAESMGLSAYNSLNVMYVYENTNFRTNFQQKNVLVPFSYEGETEPFDLNFELMEHSGVVDVHLRYRTAVFCRDTVERFAQMLHLVIEQVIASPQMSIGKISTVTEAERKKLLYDFNETTIPYVPASIPQLFEEQAVSHPEHIAVEDSCGNLTYLQLRTAAKHIAGALLSKGIRHGDVIAISVEPGIEMLQGILGILYAGAAYLPIATNCPEERLTYMLGDSNAVMVITDHDMETAGCALTSVQELLSCVCQDSMATVLPDDLAYIIYTSGTTGKPKGVLVNHDGVSNLREYFRIYQNVTAEDRVLQFASVAFDAAISEFCMSILSGGSLYIVPEKYRSDSQWLENYIAEKEITISVLPPIVLQRLAPEKLSSMRTIITAGSETTKSIVERYRNIPIYSNDYGPTEATVCATYWKHVSGTNTPQRIPIGKPICNKKIYILNGEALCNIGIKGELCIAGDGIARGYLGMPELTAQKFVPCPFTGGKMYRSGDIARWLPDGNIELSNRMDTQIKLRGYRIELGEIEAVVDNITEILSCVVTLIKDSTGEEAIALYYVAEKALEGSVIRTSMAKKLPEYMLPTFFIQIDEIPLNRNGKPDMQKLPTLEPKKWREYVAPQTKVETQICNLMAELLKQEQVGATDNFFEIGGHSLRATLLLNRIEETMGTTLGQRAIYSAPTPRLLAHLVEAEAANTNIQIPLAESKDCYEMSFAQKRIYSVVSLSPDGTAYNMPQIFRLSGHTDRGKLRKVIQDIVDAHSILRTSFRIVDGQPRQIISPRLTVDIPLLENTGEPIQVQMERFVRPFDLSQAPLLRIALIPGDNCDYMLADFHHIICDGMSLLNFSKEFIQRYNDRLPDQSRVQYIDYCEWMRTRDLSAQRAYWHEEFSDQPQLLNLTTDYSRPSELSYRGSSCVSTMQKDMSQRMDQLAYRTGTTPYVVFLSTLMLLLQRYSGGQNDIIVGTPISGRTRKETEGMLGMFVNTLAMRGCPQGKQSFVDFLAVMKNRCLDAYENQEYPFEQLVSELSLGGDMSHNPLFDVMLAFQNNEELDMEIDGIQVEALGFVNNTSKFDLTWNVEKRSDAYEITLEYSTDLFTEETAQRMLKHFIHLAGEVLNQPEAAMEIYELILPEERELWQKVNQTNADFTPFTIHELFEQQVRRDGQAPAIVYDRTVSFQELNEAANALSEQLRENGIGHGDFVAIMADRSIEFFGAVLAVLKSGAIYVPIDPGLPEKRIQYILSDCNPKCLLTYGVADIPFDFELIYALKPMNLWGKSSKNPSVGSDIHDVAYCIYTSGTTGNPKGVLVEHIGISNLREYFIQKQQIGPSDRTLQFSNYSFDASVSEMTLGILTGACMYLVPDDVRNNYEKMHKFLIENQITAAIFPPHYVRNLDVAGMRLVISAGSESSSEVADHCRTAQVYSNDYGPTEGTVCATYWKHLSDQPIPQRIPIGRPINNKHIYILNGITQCGCNIPGELCIGGIGLARGYLGLPDLTEQKFVVHPHTGERIYRTGDLARLLPDGNIEFLGRIDKQVKVRGFRIELHEIEHAILNQNGVLDCTVQVYKRNNDNEKIVAYIVTSETLTPETMSQMLAQTLPMYMLPDYYVQMEQIPYNRSGKVDERALPEPAMHQEKYRAPENEIESVLCEVFEQVLGVQKVGVNDSFFELGGDSIRAINVVSLLSEKGYSLSYRNMMLHKTPAAVAPMVMVEKLHTFEPVSGYVHDTPMIRKFRHWKLAEPEHFDQSVLLELDENCAPYLQEAMLSLVKHHDILRSIWRQDGIYIQPEDCGRQIECYTYLLEETTSVEREILARCAIIQASFDLNRGPLLKSAYFRTPIGSYLLLCAHHLVIDRLSWDVLASDLQKCIQSIASGEIPVLPSKTASLVDWAAYLKEYVSTEQCCSQKLYWNSVVAEVANWRFPIDGDSTEQTRGTVELIIDEEFTMKLLSSDHAYGTQTHELLLAALALAAMRTQNLTKIAVMMESNGRHELHRPINVSRSVGWFTNTFPVLIPCNSQTDQAIISAKDALREILDNGMAYSTCFYDESATEHCISFNYLGRMDHNALYSRMSDALSGTDVAANNRFLSEIDLMGRIVGGQLRLTLSYEVAKHKTETMQRLADVMKEALQDIVDLCSTAKTRFVTRTDIAEAGIKQNEFDEIIGMDFG